MPPEPSRPVAVGDEFENLGRTGARRLIVTEIAALGDATFLEYEILAADPSAKQGWQVGDRQHIIPNALRDPTKYRLVAHIP